MDNETHRFIIPSLRACRLMREMLMHIRQNGKFCKENKIMLDMTTLKTSSSQELTHHRTYMKVILRSSNTHMHSSTHTHTQIDDDEGDGDDDDNDDDDDD